MPTADKFITAFKQVLQDRYDADAEKLLAAYVQNRAWTAYMLSNNSDDNGVLKDTAEKLRQFDESLRYGVEWYTIDAVFYGGENLLEAGEYPSRLYAIIEHENSDDVGHEMWKLLHWRCPLKILIFYDWNEEDKRTENRRRFMQNTLCSLKKMHSAVSQFQAKENAEYLLITANRKMMMPCLSGVTPWTLVRPSPQSL